ncbi:bifunctional WXG100 family type VII secretion target/C40 family peptidase [Rhodococcus spongiicola]|uniref:NlpC/P60 family protein n=1 Tax=Rhodococcus spongiicola TaxID=2487352 RepID=A0A3S3AN28_9NOCA|nr:C40 family peptidase [Rhodococcus spongiicola]RVW04524.1 NlpC/P60 family protein [Rhodococcus spongiicola]
MIGLLARPVVDLLGAFGTGTPPTESPVEAIREASDAIDAVHARGRTAISDIGGVWSGTAADAAIDRAQATQAASVQLSDRGREIAGVTETASHAVRAGAAELRAILDSFLSMASSALPLVATPTGQTVLITVAIDHLGRALGVVERVRGELAVLTARMIELTGADPVPAEARTVDGVSAGSIEILLPDGSTVIAPNPAAADAVRNALTQQGVAYEWGGTTAGRGLDCSGLTQWAYGEAGVDLPRLAQQQSVGMPVGEEGLMPGDLAVWDGHVAMIIGNGQMIEAGDPIGISPIRTTNSSMGFHGFYRPTERTY